MSVIERESVLERTGAARQSIALLPEQVRALDEQLAHSWNIDFLQAAGLDHLIPADSPYWQAHGAVCDAKMTGVSHAVVEQREAKLYDAIASSSAMGPATSQRRALILDAIAMAAGLVKALDIKGPILDAGCHVGFAASILAKMLPNEIAGIDPSQTSIETGRGHPSMDSRVSLYVGRLPWRTEKRFELALAISSMPSLKRGAGEFLRGVSDLLHDGGIAVTVSAWWHDADVDRVRAMLKVLRLGFGYADVVGGYQGMPLKFESEGVVILIKGGTRLFPRRVRAAMEAEWPLFQPYANDRSTALREKTQAFERAIRRAQGLPGVSG
jgi:SAM-dependent methyltransferase